NIGSHLAERRKGRSKRMNIIKSIVGTILRNWLSVFLTYMLARKWISQDQSGQINIWFNGWIDLAVTAFLGSLIPIALGVYARLKDRLKLKIALLLPKGTHESTVQELAKAAPVSA